MTTETPVLLETSGAVATITLNRPQAMNTLDVAMGRALRKALDSLARDHSIRAVIVRGAGRCFSAGGDVSMLAAHPESVPELIAEVHGAARAMAALDAPVIASVHGVAAGAGMSLVAACDLAIAAERTRFNLAFANVGASCDTSSTWHLPRLLGLRRALEIALLGDTCDADTALRIGLVNRVVAADALEAETLALARRLASGATLAFGRIKRLMRHSFESSLTDQLDAEREAFIASSHTEDFREGTAAFLAKRAPQFRGC